MAAKKSDRVLATAQLMMLVQRLRGIRGYVYKQEIPDGHGGVTIKLGRTMDLVSWGEDITIHMFPHNAQQTMIEIVSECVMPTQLIDWGQNSKNVNEIMGYMLAGINVQRV